MDIFFIFSGFFYFEKIKNAFFFGCFDTSGYMIPLLVPEISPCDGFCDAHARGEELGIIVVGWVVMKLVIMAVVVLLVVPILS